VKNRGGRLVETAEAAAAGGTWEGRHKKQARTSHPVLVRGSESSTSRDQGGVETARSRSGLRAAKSGASGGEGQRHKIRTDGGKGQKERDRSAPGASG